MMAVPYFGPGQQDMTLGRDDDKWQGVFAKKATIDEFKNIGDKASPVYFDENGQPQPVTEFGGRAKTAEMAEKAKECTGNAASADAAAGLSVVGGKIYVTYEA